MAKLLPPDTKRLAVLAAKLRELPPGDPIPKSWLNAVRDMTWKRVIPERKQPCPSS